MTNNTWQLDPSHASIEFAVRHLMIATVRGRFSGLKGTITVDERNPTAGTVEVTIDTASIDTRQEQRDAHLRSPDFLDVANFPTITFVGRHAEGDPGGDFRLIGDLTIRGVTRQITLDATAEGTGPDPWGNVRAGFSAKGEIDRRDFGLVWNQALEAGGIAVGDKVKITADVEFFRPANVKSEQHAVAV